MRLTTPQILWHALGKTPERVNSVDFCPLPPGTSADESKQTTATSHWLLATSGADPSAHIWKLSLVSSSDTADPRLDKSAPRRTSLTVSPGSVRGRSQRSGDDGGMRLTLQQRLQGHEKEVNMIRFSADGTAIATAGADESVIVWRQRKNSEFGGVAPFGASSSVEDVDAEAAKPDALVWRRQALCRCMSPATSVSWSPCGKYLAAGIEDDKVVIFDANTGRPVNHLSGHSHIVMGVAWNPVGAYIASQSSDQSLRLWQPRRGRGAQRQPGGWRAAAVLRSYAVDETADENAKVSQNGSRKELLASPGSSKKRMVKKKLFMNEASVAAFFRRPDWTCDGNLLIAPCGLWRAAAQSSNSTDSKSHSPHSQSEMCSDAVPVDQTTGEGCVGREKDAAACASSADCSAAAGSLFCCTFAFLKSHKNGGIVSQKPAGVFPAHPHGGAVLAVRCAPRAFRTARSVPSDKAQSDAAGGTPNRGHLSVEEPRADITSTDLLKESRQPPSSASNFEDLPNGQPREATGPNSDSPVVHGDDGDEESSASGEGKFIFASGDGGGGFTVWDSECAHPLLDVRRAHFHAITDLAWSPDCRILAVSSSDGYISFVIFNPENDFGELLPPPFETALLAAEVPSPHSAPQVSSPAKELLQKKLAGKRCTAGSPSLPEILVEPAAASSSSVGILAAESHGGKKRRRIEPTVVAIS